MQEFHTQNVVVSASTSALKNCDYRTEFNKQTRCFHCQHPNVISLNGRVTPEFCSVCSFPDQKSQSSFVESMSTIHVSLTTYNRARMLKEVLDDIYREGKGYNLLVDIYDDGTSDDLSFLKTYPQLRHFRRDKNGGVPAYCYLIHFAFQQLSVIEADYHFFLPDDVRLVSEFFSRSIDIYESIDDPQKIALNLLLDKSREGQPCWTQFHPQRKQFGNHSVWLTQWTDMCFMARGEFFETLKFNVDPISLSRWRKDPHRSTGVGEQFSHKLVNAGKHLYHVTDNLVHHGKHSSRLFPELRQRQPLIAVPNEPVIAGLATIPSREKLLPMMVNSILSQVDQLHIYLNGFKSIPDFLDDDKIHCYLSQDHLGDLGDAGKFYTVGKQAGYYFSLDDDICYPPDYVSSLLEKIEEYDRSSVVGLHGIRVAPPIQSYYRNRRVYHCRANLDQDHPVHILGTGVSAFHTQALDLRIDDFPKPNMADIWLGLAAQVQETALNVIAHKSDWLKVLQIDDTIYKRHHNDDHIQTQLINSIPDWVLWTNPGSLRDNSEDVQALKSNSPIDSNLGSYATHIPFLDFLVKEFAPQNILEFGMGLHSTPLLVESGAKVISLETDSNWWEQTKTKSPRHQSILWPNEKVQDFLLKNDPFQFDLVFVDGPVDSRVPCAQRLFGQARFIVIHDSFTRCYGWGKLHVPPDYKRFDYCELSPETSVFANNPKDWPSIEKFCQTHCSMGVST